MRKIAIAALLSAFAAAPAFAGTPGKFYLAGDLGAATYSNMDPFPNPGIFRFAGGYHFSPNLAAEVGLSIFGDSTVTGPGFSATLEAQSFQVAAIGSLPLSPEFDLIGKLGLASNSAKISGSFGSASTSQNSLLIGVGAQFHFSPQLNFRVQYDNYGKFESYSPGMEATSFSLGLVFNF